MDFFTKVSSERRIRSLVLLACAITARSPAFAHPRDAMFSIKTPACFQHIYDGAHLQIHPHQRVVMIRLMHRPDLWPRLDDGRFYVSLQIKLRGDETLYQLGGFCRAARVSLTCRPQWRAGAWHILAAPDGQIDVINAGLLVNPDGFAAETVAPHAVAVPPVLDDRRWRLEPLPEANVCGP